MSETIKKIKEKASGSIRTDSMRMTPTSASGKTANMLDRAPIFTTTATTTSAVSKTIPYTERALTSRQPLHMSANGATMRWRARVPKLGPMAISTLADGRETRSTGKEKKHGLRILATRVASRTANARDMVSCSIRRVRPTRVTSPKARSAAKENGP